MYPLPAIPPVLVEGSGVGLCSWPCGDWFTPLQRRQARLTANGFALHCLYASTRVSPSRTVCDETVMSRIQSAGLVSGGSSNPAGGTTSTESIGRLMAGLCIALWGYDMRTEARGVGRVGKLSCQRWTQLYSHGSYRYRNVRQVRSMACAGARINNTTYVHGTAYPKCGDRPRGQTYAPSGRTT